MLWIKLKDPLIKTISNEKIKIIIVLIAIATFDPIFLIPHFASIDVIPAKNADIKDIMIHILNPPKNIFYK